TDAGLPTSVGTASSRPPAAAPAAATASNGSLRRPASTTAKPSLTSASATCLPIPVPAPVTTAIFSLIDDLSFYRHPGEGRDPCRQRPGGGWMDPGFRRGDA